MSGPSTSSSSSDGNENNDNIQIITKTTTSSTVDDVTKTTTTQQQQPIPPTNNNACSSDDDGCVQVAVRVRPMLQHERQNAATECIDVFKTAGISEQQQSRFDNNQCYSIGWIVWSEIYIRSGI